MLLLYHKPIWESEKPIIIWDYLILLTVIWKKH